MDDFLSKETKLLLKEAGLASTCIGQGLTILRKANFVNKWNYYQAFFLLSIGIERLLKITIISYYRGVNNGEFPSQKYLKDLGHDIKGLIAAVESYNLNHNDNPPINDEIELLIVDFLTTFAKGSRYYNIDAILGSNTNSDPLVDWKKIQNRIKDVKILKSKILNPELFKAIDSFASFMMHDEEGNLISNAEQFYQDSKILDKLQGYSVYYLWRIITSIAERLSFLEYKYGQYPYLREFFPYFINDWDKRINVLKFKDWNYLK